MGTLVKVTAVLTAKLGREQDLQDLLVGMAPSCRAEAGNLRWDVWRDSAVAGRFVLDELYRDDAAVERHRQTPHYLNYRATIDELADRTATVLVPVDVREAPGEPT